MLSSGKDKSAKLEECQMPCTELISLSLPSSASAHNSSMLFYHSPKRQKLRKIVQSNDRGVGQFNFKKLQMGKKRREVIINN